MRKGCIAVVALFTISAWAQDVARVYHFANTQSPAGFQEVVNVFRTVGDLRTVSVDTANATLAAQGTADQMALTDWLFPELDQAAGEPAPANHTYTMTGTDGVVRVFHFAHATQPAQVQAIINVVRTALDINRVFPVMGPGLLVVRGTADQAALADWLVSQLDVSKPTPNAAVEARQFPGVRDPEIRVVHLAHTDSPVGLQELTNTVRAIADMNRVFPVNAAGVVVLRSTADQVALGEWLIGQLDQPAGQQGPAPHQQQLAAAWARSDSEARVFYLTHADTAQAMMDIANAVRKTAKVPRIFTCAQAKAMAVRGTASQMAQAASVIAELDK
jgi:type II secretory pathway component GspD/PulD (secretin)